MGTNYFLHSQKCPHCGIERKDKMHLGKSSVGWCFSLHVYPELELNDWDGILKYIRFCLAEYGYRIENEYGDQISLTDFVKIVTERSHFRPWDQNKLFANRAVQGPNNLARHIIDDWHCIGHGEGTYDYIIGEFS